MASKEELAIQFLEIRQDDAVPKNNATNLTDNQVLALEAVSLSFATLSVFAAFVAFYWFVRMRRSFRQDLIMLLIQSDMMKAFWLMLSPIIYFISGPDGPINTDSAYCQISGFLLTTAVEASDIAVLMIAVHSALYILRSHRPSGESGLQPYRWYAYFVWLVVPLILAALVPITGGRFEDNGPFCYLPSRNSWYRIYLSWVPRYIIFGVIFMVYAFLYAYIAWRFRRLRKVQRRASIQSNVSPKSIWRRNRGQTQSQAAPPTPPLVSHGLLDTQSTQAPHEEHQRSRQQSVTSEVSTLKLPDHAPTPLTPQQIPTVPDEAFSWNWVKAAYDDTTESPRPFDETGSTLLSPTPASLDVQSPQIPLPPPPPAAQSSPQPEVPAVAMLRSKLSHPTQASPRPFWRRPLSASSDTVKDGDPTHRGMPQDGSPQLADDVPSSTSPSPSSFLPLSVADDTLRRSHKKMNRQLRLLFVYPAIYIIAWIAPFVSQLYRYESRTDEPVPQPYGLFIVSIASLCIGAAVDCCFYSAWEKPWRHSKCGFWEGLAMRLKLKHRPHGQGGRTRDEERRDATVAIDRRNVEHAARRAAAAMQRTRSARAPRQWWDIDEDSNEDSDLENQH